MRLFRGDNVEFFYRRAIKDTPGEVWVSVGDADALFEGYRSSGAKVRHLPTNYSWAYEVQVEDLDGNVLRFGSDPKSSKTVGEWLDMCGDRWVMSTENEWTRADSQ